MKILTRYLLKDLFYHFIVIMGLFTIIMLAKEMYDTRDEILDQRPTFSAVAQYVVLALPKQVSDAIPLIAMFAVLFTIGLMAKNREIIAMVAAGVSFNFLAIPVLIYGLGVSAISFALTEYVAPMAQRRADYVYEIEIKGGNPEKFVSSENVFRKGAGDRFYVVASYNEKGRTMTRPSILDRNAEGTGIVARIEGKKAQIVDSESKGKSVWEFEKAQKWSFAPDGKASVEKFDAPLRLEMDEKLDGLLQSEKSPEEMRIGELRDVCSILSQQRNSPTLPKYQTFLNAKFSLPLACLLLALIGFAVASDVRNRNFVLVFGVGLVLGVVYYVLREAMLGLGKSGAMSSLLGPMGPIFAAWIPVAAFGIAALALIRRLSTVH